MGGQLVTVEKELQRKMRQSFMVREIRVGGMGGQVVTVVRESERKMRQSFIWKLLEREEGVVR